MADDPRGARWRGVVGFALLAALVLGALYMVRQLRDAASVQDCVASGRTNCAPIIAGR